MAHVTNIPPEEDIWEELTSLVIDDNQPWIDFHVYGSTVWDKVIRTCYGHFCALYAYYIYTHRSPTMDQQMTYSGVLDDLYTRYGNPNSRRTTFPLIYSKTGVGLFSFIEWITSAAPNIMDADPEIYDWYPPTAKSNWNHALGNPKTYPGWTLVMGATSAPNQQKSFGPYINYVYGAGNKNAISQNILLKDQRTIIQDYAKYKGPPGFRSTPYSELKTGTAMTSRNKISYDEWKEKPYLTNRYFWQNIKGGLSGLPIALRDENDPMFFTFQSVSNARALKKKRLAPYLTINYDSRYLDLLGDII